MKRLCVRVYVIVCVCYSETMSMVMCLCSMSQGSTSLHGGSTIPGYDLSVTRAAMMSVSVTEPSKSSLLMLDDLGVSASASKAAAPSAYSNNTNLSKDFINAKV